MVEDLDGVFHALAHEARRSMLRRVGGGGAGAGGGGRGWPVGGRAEPLHMSLAAASKHVKVLEQAGLVNRTIAGRRHVCRLDARPLSEATAWLRFYEEVWDNRLDALRDVLDPKEKS